MRKENSSRNSLLPLLHIYKNWSLGPRKSEALSTRVSGVFYRHYQTMTRHGHFVTHSKLPQAYVNLSKKFNTLQNKNFNFFLKLRIDKFIFPSKIYALIHWTVFLLYICIQMQQRQFDSGYGQTKENIKIKFGNFLYNLAIDWCLNAND